MSAAPRLASPTTARSYLLSGDGWPYLLVPFIPVAIALDFSQALLVGSILLVMGGAMLAGGLGRERLSRPIAVFA